mmetsp:Transcript_14766/g.42493  ORF Transcript_14766/g.42493 Transcript_14766/m.42493 type:complete len:374 (-) Transcript_14766:1132-2253(-)
MGLSGVLRSDLNATTATRFDHLTAAPSSQQQLIVWITWSALAGLVGVCTIIFFLGIITSRKVRNRSFNVYVLFITFPGILFSVACSITCGLNAATGRYYSERMCSFQSFYVVFSFTSIAWLNAAIIHQVHAMLKSSNNHRRYTPPETKTVCFQAFMIYLYASIIASLSFFRTSVHHHSDARGLACLPIERDVPSSLFFWLCFFWLMIGVPLVYVVYVWFDVQRNKLVPPGEKTKSVIIFFRLLAVFVGMWLPTIIAIYLAGAIDGPWLAFAGGTLSHLQPLASAWVVMAKHDIREAVRKFITCQRWNQARWVHRLSRLSSSRASRFDRQTAESERDDAVLVKVSFEVSENDGDDEGEVEDNFQEDEPEQAEPV